MNKKRKTALFSKWYFLIPVVMIMFNIIVAYVFYDSIPSKIPKHWNVKGVVDAWSNKSMMAVMFIPAVEIFITIIMYFSYLSTVLSKKQINVENPEQSKEKLLIFRRVWTKFTVIAAIGLNLMFTIMHLESIQIFKISSIFSIGYVIIFPLVLVVYSIYISFKYGEGGTKYNLHKSSSDAKYVTKDDDEHWKLGLFYYNREDSSIFVEKRFGVGWTLNFATKGAVMVSLGFVVLTLLFMKFIFYIDGK